MILWWSQQVPPLGSLLLSVIKRYTLGPSFVMHLVGVAASATAQVYILPNGGSVSRDTKIFDVDINAGETVLLEPSYPIVIASTGETISVGAGSSTVNFFITGDQEGLINGSN